MDLKPLMIEDLLRGKPVYPAVRRVLSILFSVSITSFLFERFFFRYTLIDITDYKALYDFFIKGFFFVPFFLYVLVHLSLDYTSRLIYDILITIKANKYRKKILSTRIKKSEAKKIIKDLNQKTSIPFVVTIPWLYSIYQYFNNNYSHEQWTKMLVDLEKAKRGNEGNFKLIFKAMFAISIYLTNVPYFGWKLYVLSLFLLVIYGLLLFGAYLLMEVGPLGIQKIHADITEYFAKQEENQNIAANP